MEAFAQTSYHGCKAFYKITSLNLIRFHAVLTDFLGRETDTPPKQIDFTYYNHRATIINYNQRIVSKSVVVNIASDLMTQVILKGGSDLR